MVIQIDPKDLIPDSRVYLKDTFPDLLINSQKTNMAEALRSAIGIRERPASSYYDLSGRAEGQPTLNRQEEGGRRWQIKQSHKGGGRRDVHY